MYSGFRHCSRQDIFHEMFGSINLHYSFICSLKRFEMKLQLTFSSLEAKLEKQHSKKYPYSILDEVC